MKKITAAKLKQLIHSQIEKPGTSKWIRIENYTITNQFVSNLCKVKDIGKNHFGIYFSGCTFEGGFFLRLFEQPISISIRDSMFKKSLSIYTNKTGRRKNHISLINVVVKGPLSISVKGYEEWRLIEVEAPSIHLQQYDPVEEIILGKLTFRSIEISLPLGEKPKTEISWCDQSMVPLATTMFSGVRIKGIYNDLPALRKRWPFI